MHDAALMRVAQGTGRFPQDALDLGHRQRPLLVEQVFERRAGDVLHYEVVEPALTLHAIDRDDVRMVQLGGGLRFLLEPSHDLVVLRDVGRQHLDRDVALEGEVVSQEHGAHPALP